MIRFKNILVRSFAIVCMSMLLNCEKKVQETEVVSSESQNTDTKITQKDIDAIEYTDYALSDTAEKVTQNWLPFQEINKQVEFLKQADLSFFKDDKAILKSTLDDLKNEIPDRLNETAIEVRLISLETNAYKLEGVAILENSKKEDLISAVKDVLLAHTNLVFQINRKLEKDSQQIQKPNQ